MTADLQWSVADLLRWAPPAARMAEELAVPTWSGDTRVDLAASDNAFRVEDVARAAGVVSHRTADRWWATARTPPLHPDVVTLRRGLSADEVLAGVDDGPGCSVKDSYADLDLSDRGLAVIIEGSWLWWGAARSAASGRGWQWSDSLTGDLVAILDGATVASCNVTRSGPVVGVTNLDAPGVDDVVAWTEARAAVAGIAPNAPVVAWEPADGVAAAVAAGGVVTGPMRVWARD